MKKRQFQRVRVALCSCLCILLSCSGLTVAQQPAGVVTALEGTAQLTRPATPAPAGLRFKDGLFIRDIIDTQEKSLVRALFGGRSTVTVRELSRLEVREERLPTGAALSVHELSSGGILVNVARQLLRPGDEVQIRTPNAVAAVRGTTISVQCNPALAQCVFAVLAGSALITPLGRPTLTLTANTTVTITGTQATGVQISPIQAIAPPQATQLLQQYEVRHAVTESASQQQTARGQIQTATELATTVAEAVTGVTTPVSREAATAIGTPAAEQTATAVITAPLTPDVVEATEQLLTPPVQLPSPLLPFRLTGAFTLPAPDSLFEAPGGRTATVTSSLLDATDAAVTLGANALLVAGSLMSTTPDPLFVVDPSTVSLAGSLVLVQAGGVFSFAGPLLDLTGSTLTTTGGPLVLVETGGSLSAAITGTTPLLSLNASSIASAASLLDVSNSTLTLAGPLAQLRNASTLTNTTGPVIRLSGSSLTADALFATDGMGNTLQLTGTLLDLAGTTVTLRRLVDALSMDTVTHMLAAGEPLVRLEASALTMSGVGLPFVRFGSDSGTPATQTGVALIATSGSTINIQGSLLALNGVTLTDPNSQIQLTQTTVTHTGPTSLIEAGSLPVSGPGPLLAATDSTISAAADLFRIQGGSLTATATSPLIQTDRSTVSMADFFAEINGGLSLAAPLLRASDSMLTSGADFVMVGNGATLTSTTTEPLMQLTNSPVMAFTLVFVDGGTMNLAGGPLLSATNSDLNLDFALVDSEFGG
jgi:FecR protein